MEKDDKTSWREVEDELLKNTRQLKLAKYYTYSIDNDIKHLGFAFARYKFAAKMIGRKKHITLLELGCNNGLGAKFFEQTGACDKILGVDFDDGAISWAKENIADDKIEFLEDDFLAKDYSSKTSGGRKFDAIVSIDVIEHIPKTKENDILKTIDINLKDDGVAVIGTPNITMKPYASAGSSENHVNLFSPDRLHEFLSQIFANVFIFGMNDEVIHTGFDPMCCYIMAVCAGKIKQ